MIDIYSFRLEDEIVKSQILISHRFQLTRTSPTTGYIDAFILFQDGSKLCVFEFLREVGGVVTREKYRYHYMDVRNNMIFRYDDAPHHKFVTTFPDHKHFGTSVLDSSAPSVKEVLKEIECLVLGLP